MTLPLEPTSEMLDVAVGPDVWGPDRHVLPTRSLAAKVWHAMAAAAGAQPAPEAPPAPEVTVWTVAVAMIKHERGDTIRTITQSWRHGGTEEEALGSAIQHAMQAKPGFAVEQFLVGKIKLAASPPQPDLAERDGRLVYTLRRAVRDQAYIKFEPDVSRSYRDGWIGACESLGDIMNDAAKKWQEDEAEHG